LIVNSTVESSFATTSFNAFQVADDCIHKMLYVPTTSFDVNAEPSLHFIPLRRLIVIVVTPGAAATVGAVVGAGFVASGGLVGSGALVAGTAVGATVGGTAVGFGASVGLGAGVGVGAAHATSATSAINNASASKSFFIFFSSELVG
jgi:hypothetical protein